MPAWLTKDLIIDLVVCVFFFAAGYETETKLEEAAQAETLKAQAVAEASMLKVANEKAAAWEIKRAALEKENKDLSGRLKHETKNVIYSKCLVPDDGVRIYNDAVSGTSGPGVPSSVLP